MLQLEPQPSPNTQRGPEMMRVVGALWLLLTATLLVVLLGCLMPQHARLGIFKDLICY